MNKKPKLNDLVKREIESPQPHEISKPQWSDLETAKIIAELADRYEIPYESSTRRIKTKFLFLPKTINGKTKWLVKASWQEEFKEEIDQEALDLGSTNILTFIWKPIKWIEK